MPSVILPSDLPREVEAGKWEKLFTTWRSEFAQTFIGDVVVSFASIEDIKNLNHRHAGKATPTDVLSFAYDPPLQDEQGVMIAGEVVICPEVAQKFVDRHEINLSDEYATLYVHGLLHLAGWDHQTDEERRRYESATRAIIESGGYQTVSLWLD